MVHLAIENDQNSLNIRLFKILIVLPPRYLLNSDGYSCLGEDLVSLISWINGIIKLPADVKRGCFPLS
jgi:hypothetical protein